MITYFDYEKAAQRAKTITTEQRTIICRMLSEGMPLADICGVWGLGEGLGCTLGDVLQSCALSEKTRVDIEKAQSVGERARHELQLSIVTNALTNPTRENVTAAELALKLRREYVDKSKVTARTASRGARGISLVAALGSG